MRSSFKFLIVAPVLMLAAACSNDKPADPALSSDLGLAAQAGNQPRLDSITAAERLNAAAPVAVAPRPTATPARRTTTTTTRRSTNTSGSTGSSSSSSSNTTVAREPQTVTTKNTKRDAAIGAAAGAVLGGVVAKGGVKGAVIGGVAGGILGGVIGNNVDVQKKKVP
jgi:hypothetical protein